MKTFKTINYENYSQNSNETITSLNINHLPTGIYYISINNGKEVMTQKVVKK